MRELIFLAIGFFGSLGFGLYRMRDRIGKFVCGFEDDREPIVNFYYDPYTQTFSYELKNGAKAYVHQRRINDHLGISEPSGKEGE